MGAIVTCRFSAPQGEAGRRGDWVGEMGKLDGISVEEPGVAD